MTREQSRSRLADGSGTRPAPAPPALDAKEFRRLGNLAVDLAADHLSRIGHGKVHQPMPEAARRVLRDQPLPDYGSDPEAMVRFVAERVMPYPMGNGHPRFFAWIVGTPSHMGVLGELLAAALNPGCGGGDHAAIELERCVTRWLMELVGFPTVGSKGLLVSGGSMATLTGLAAARHWAAREDGWDIRAEGFGNGRPRPMLYASEEGHSCIEKSAELLGLGRRSLRKLSCDPAWRIDAAALEAAIKEDRAKGMRPFCVVANAGTVNTGAVDPLDRIADLCAEHNLWMHVDGAYGVFGVLDPKAAVAFAGLARADSVALDPHKWLSVPIECGCLLVRDAALLRDAFSLVPSYLQSAPDGSVDLAWPHEYGFQLTRGFRALKLWATVVHTGRLGLAATIARCNALARRLAAAVEAAPELELMAPVTLSVVCFRYTPAKPQKDEHYLATLNKAINETVNEQGDVFFTTTSLGGRLALRACIIHHDTTYDDVDLLIDQVRSTGRRLSGA